MSDIPVGSPEPPPGRHAAPGGWYPDPVDAARERYWDGWQWSRDVREAQHPPRPQRPPAHGGYGAATAGPAPALTADGVPLAGWWLRALAVLVDAVILGVLITLASLPFMATFLETFRSYWDASMQAAAQGLPAPPRPDTAAMITAQESTVVTAITVTIGLIWHTSFLRFRSATPGKLVVGLRVVPVDEGRSNERLGWRTALLRAAIWVLPGLHTLLTVVGVVDVILPLTNPRKQALHDMAARTQVVRRR